jgi:hypothetical protein
MATVDLLQWQHHTAGPPTRTFNRPTEVEMSTSRVVFGVIVVALATTAAITAREAAAIERTNQPSNYYSGADFAQRHPQLSQPSAVRLDQLVAIKDDGQPASADADMRSAARLDQLAQIKDGGLSVTHAADLSDYALRHPELRGATSPVDTSDFYLRHPTWVSTPWTVDPRIFTLRNPSGGVQP